MEEATVIAEFVIYGCEDNRELDRGLSGLGVYYFCWQPSVDDYIHDLDLCYHILNNMMRYSSIYMRSL